MKKIAMLMLGLVAGTASFAQTTDSNAPAAAVTITSDQKLKLVVGRDEATATISLRDNEGHTLYTENVSLHNGVRQNFDVATLAGGAYQLSVAVGKNTVVKTFVIETQPAQKFVALRS